MVVWVLWHINLCRLFNAKSIFIQKSVLFQTIQLSMSTYFVKTLLFPAIQFSQTVLIQTIQFCVSIVSVSKTVPFQTIHFSISMQFSSIWSIDRTLSGATTSGQSGVMVTKRCSAFPKAPALLRPHHQII